MAEYGVATISVLMPHPRLRPRAADPPRPWNPTQPSPISATHIGKRLAGKLHEPFERAGGGRATSPTPPDSTAFLPTAWRFGKASRIRLAIAGADADHYGQVPHGRPPVFTINRGKSFLDLPCLPIEGAADRIDTR